MNTSTQPRLLVSKNDAVERINKRIALGWEILSRRIATVEALDSAREEYSKWNKYNADLLQTIFSTPKFADEYSFVGGFMVGPAAIGVEIKELQDDVRSKISRLESVLDRMDLFEISAPEVARQDRPTLSRPAPSSSRRVFVVHGHDGHMKEAVTRLLERLRIDPIVLAEQPNGGRTIIEKFEAEADVQFAVVLLSPDDHGAKAGSEEYQNRARQNVILELGYFVGKLGRSNVCALQKGDLELPSDFVGVAYTKFSEDGNWQLNLAREMRAASLDVDLNLL